MLAKADKNQSEIRINFFEEFLIFFNIKINQVSIWFFFLQSKNIKTVLKTPPLWGEDNLLGTMTAKFQVDTSKHLFSLLSMIGPSPDWCVGEWEGAEVPPGEPPVDNVTVIYRSYDHVLAAEY